MFLNINLGTLGFLQTWIRKKKLFDAFSVSCFHTAPEMVYGLLL